LGRKVWGCVLWNCQLALPSGAVQTHSFDHLLIECGGEFITLISSEANETSEKEAKSASPTSEGEGSMRSFSRPMAFFWSADELEAYRSL
jgi:hypothetical protein